MADEVPKFDEPLILKTETQLLSFHTLEELKEWAEYERSFWNEIQNKIGSQRPFQSDPFLGPLVNRAQRLADAIPAYLASPPDKRADLYSHFNDLLALFSGNPSITHENTEAQLIADLSDTDAAAAWMRLAIAYGGRAANGQRVQLSQKDDLLGLIVSLERLRGASRDPDAAIRAIDQAAGGIHSRWDTRFSEQFDSVQRHLQKAEDEAKKWRRIALGRLVQYKNLHRQHSKQMQDIEQAFTTKMELQAAEFYWDDKLKGHICRAREASTAWWLALLFGGIILSVIWALTYRFVGFPTQWDLTRATFYALPIIPYLWVLRTFGTERKLNRRMADDAEERIAMVKTFRALEYSGKISGEERIIVLNALFRQFASDGDETVPFAVVEAIKHAAGRSN